MTKDGFYQKIAQADLAKLVHQHSTPSYIFFPAFIKQRIAEVRDCLPPEFDLYYATKANPSPQVLAIMAEQGVGGDVASLGEMQAVLVAGTAGSRISFSGPGKTRAELKAALEHQIGSLNIESLEELEILLELAKDYAHKPRVGVRINPDARRIKSGLKMAGETQFGIPEADLAQIYAAFDKHAEALEFTGLHVHAGSQVLDAQSIVENFKSIMDLALTMEQDGKRPMQKINFGGGWGIDYFPNQNPLDRAALKQGLAELFAAQPYAELKTRCKLVMEPGRYLVAESGIYVAPVLYRKHIGEKEFAVVQGGMHHNYLLAGGMGQIIRRNFQMDILHNPEAPAPQAQEFELEVAGSLCTPQDVLAMKHPCTAEVRPGDYIVFFNCGAYGLSASPINFLSHPVADQHFLSV